MILCLFGIQEQSAITAGCFGAPAEPYRTAVLAICETPRDNILDKYHDKYHGLYVTLDYYEDDQNSVSVIVRTKNLDLSIFLFRKTNLRSNQGVEILSVERAITRKTFDDSSLVFVFYDFIVLKALLMTS